MNSGGINDAGDAIKAGDERRKFTGVAGDPFPHRHGKSAFGGEGFCLRQVFLKPGLEPVFTITLADFIGMAKPEPLGGKMPVNKRRAPLNPVMHEAAIRLGEEIIRQPFGNIMLLQAGQCRVPVKQPLSE